MRRILLTVLAGAAVVASSVAARADVMTDDPQIFIGTLGTNKPQNGTAIGGESNLLSGTSSGTNFSVGVAGNTPMQSPLLIAFALPVTTANPNPSVELSGTPCGPNPCSLAAVTTYGLTTNTATLTAASNDIFTVLGLAPAGGNSDTYGNITKAAGLNGFCPPGTTTTNCPATYDLVVFAVPIGLDPNQGISLAEVGAPAGSFVGAYSCEIASSPNKCNPNGNVGVTPFTNVGLITDASNGTTPPPPPPPPVPEPSSLALLGAGLVGLFVGLRRRK